MADNFMEEIYGEDYIEHHGVKGMRWGVRRSRQELGYPMSRRQAKKAIKNAKRAYRKETGKWRTTGKNVADVDRRKTKAMEKDPEYQKALSKKNEIDKKRQKAIEKHEASVTKANDSKDYMRRLQEDPSASRESRRRIEEQYLKDKKSAEKARDKKERLDKEYYEADNAVASRRATIGAKYRDQYRNAVVKDLGFEDIDTGRKMLEDYGLMNRALSRADRYIY